MVNKTGIPALDVLTCHLDVELSDFEAEYLEGIARANNLSSAQVVRGLVQEYLDYAFRQSKRHKGG